MQQPLYDLEAVRPLAEELETVGVESLETAQQVDETFANKQGALLVVINSVCGCAAGSCRPGVGLALQNERIPDRTVTVFAGVHRDAVEAFRRQIPQIPPSSPFLALFKDGEVVGVLQRTDIEMMSPQQVADALKRAFDQHCQRPGPSIPKETFDKLPWANICGSSIPGFDG